jgi:hypothetical protein
MEYWKDEVMRLGYCNVGLTAIIVFTAKLKMADILKKNHYSIIPLFHYSLIEAETQTSDNTQYFHQVLEIPRSWNISFFKGKYKEIQMRLFGLQFVIDSMALFLQRNEGLRYGDDSKKKRST